MERGELNGCWSERGEGMMLSRAGLSHLLLKLFHIDIILQLIIVFL